MHGRSCSRWLRTTLAAMGVLSLGVLSPAGSSPAQAAVAPCEARAAAQKFIGVDGDSNYYFTAPSGSFEGGATGWSLSNALVASGNETRFINGAGHSGSLQLNRGGKAVSPAMCNKFGERSVRYFLRGTSGATVQLSVEARNVYNNQFGLRSVIVPVPSNGGWGVSPSISVPSVYTEGYETLKLTFTAVNGTVWIDDVEVDPFKPL